MTRLDQLLDRLFQSGGGQHADRLVLVQDLARPVNGKAFRDLGGWCRGSVRDQILAVFPELAEEDRRGR